MEPSSLSPILHLFNLQPQTHRGLMSGSFVMMLPDRSQFVASVGMFGCLFRANEVDADGRSGSSSETQARSRSLHPKWLNLCACYGWHGGTEHYSQQSYYDFANGTQEGTGREVVEIARRPTSRYHVGRLVPESLKFESKTAILCAEHGFTWN